MWRALPGLIFCIIIGVMLYLTYEKSTKPSGMQLIGKPAPSLSVTAIEGLPRIPDASVLFKHQYVLVNFFASWCTPCLEEHPHLTQLANEYNVRIAGVAWRDSPENVKNMLARHGNPYSYVGTDLLDASAYAYGVAALPESFLVNPEGKIVATYRGALLPDVIRDQLLPFLTRP